MNGVSISIANEVNRLHDLASGTARQAMDYARQAGELLLKMKRELPHGEFSNWREKHLRVSERTTQRYMAVALEEEVAIQYLAGKTDTVSDLKNALGSEILDELLDGTWVPRWQPLPGRWYMVDTEGGSYWVVPDEECPEVFHVSRLYAKAGEDLFDGTRSAEPAERVEIRLIGFGLPNPHQVQWRVRDRTGLPQPFGAPPGHGMIRVIDRRGRSRLVPDAP